MTSALRRVATAACVTVAAIVPAAPAYAVGGGFNPVSTPPKFPGTSTVVHGWKLSGVGASTAVQVAPRWVVSSAHSPLMPGQVYTSPTGTSSKVIDQVSMQQRGTNSGSDISISLLETAIPAPTGGFPLLLTEPTSFDLNSLLPGYVLWAGGAYGAAPVPSVGWARADGAPFTGSTPLSLAGGDSGSTGLLYPTATARPIMSGVTKGALSITPVFGGDTAFSHKLQPGSTENYATVADWAKAKFARFPEATPPTFSTFSGAGVVFSRLKPPAPRTLEVAAASATSVTVAWTAPTETRVPISGYRVRNVTTGISRTISAASRSYTFTGLAAGRNYTFSVKAYNANGESPVMRRFLGISDGSTTEADRIEPDRVSYLTRSNPGAPQNLTVTTERANGAKTAEWGGGTIGVDYCATASWTPAAAPAGATITRYETTLGGQVLPSPRNFLGADISTVAGPDGRISVKRCGLEAGAAQSFSVRAFSDVNASSPAAASAPTPTGSPRGTAFGAPVVTATPRVYNLPGTLDYCVKVSWTAPAPIDGVPLTDYSVSIRSSDFEYVKAFNQLGVAARSKDICNLKPGEYYDITVYARYGNLASGASDASAELPLGAPVGTVVPKPKALTVTARAATTAAGLPDRCLSISWDQPDALEGFPVKSFSVQINSADYEYVKGLTNLAPGTGRRTIEQCGLQPGNDYQVVVYAQFDSRTVGYIGSGTDVAFATTPA
ncbi:MAG: fibronectin type III domain-containing protein [Solirubrobacteraceae bacterium]|nr:fibronectin type III domain-containing protein [Solirubrobacteraceae bacterium]